MSVKVMAQVWELDLPQNEKFVLLAFADFADDDGRCYPSVRRVAWKTGYDERQIKRLIGRLRERGLMNVLKNSSPNFPVIYVLVTARGDKLSPLQPSTGDILSLPGMERGVGCQDVTPGVTKPAGRGGQGVTSGVVTVSPYPSINHQEPKKETAPAAPFALFWDAYPVKKSKGHAEKAFAKLKPTAELVATMLTAITKQTAERKARTQAGEFVPEWKYPATWINGRCWEDQAQAMLPKGGKVAPAAHDDGIEKRKRESLDIARYEQRRLRLQAQGADEPDEHFIDRINREAA